MKRGLIVLLAVALFSTMAFAAGPTQYQWTGTVLEVKDDVIVVQKGKEKWEIGRDKDTKVSGGELAVGSKVTVYYTMKASSVEVKSDVKQGDKKKPESPMTAPKKQ